jgi:hypothetical protein
MFDEPLMFKRNFVMGERPENGAIKLLEKLNILPALEIVIVKSHTK